MGKSRKKEWVITATITLRGCTSIVEAYTEQEVREKYRKDIPPDGFDTNCGELINWSIDEVEENQ